jgi:hypothetical protein
LKPQTTAPSPTDQPEVPFAPEQLARLAGLYWNDKEAMAARFSVVDGRLVGGMGGGQPLKSLGQGRFGRVAGQGPPFTFDLASAASVTIDTPAGPGTVLRRAEPWKPSASQLQSFAGSYRSDEIEAVYRIIVKDTAVRLERLKSAPAPLEPLVADHFTAPFGIIRFTRNAAGVVTGLVIEGGRVRGLKFRKEEDQEIKSSGG